MQSGCVTGRGAGGGRAGKLLIRQKQSLNECGEMKGEGSVPRAAAGLRGGGDSQRQRNDLGVGKLTGKKNPKNPNLKNKTEKSQQT